MNPTPRITRQFDKTAKALEADRRIFATGESAACAVQNACLSTGANLPAGDLIAAAVRTAPVPIGGWTGYALACQVRNAALLMVTRPKHRYLPSARTSTLVLIVLVLAAMGLLQPLAQAALVLGASAAVLAGIVAVVVGAVKSHTTTTTITTTRGARL